MLTMEDNENEVSLFPTCTVMKNKRRRKHRHSPKKGRRNRHLPSDSYPSVYPCSCEGKDLAHCSKHHQAGNLFVHRLSQLYKLEANTIWQEQKDGFRHCMRPNNECCEISNHKLKESVTTDREPKEKDRDIAPQITRRQKSTKIPHITMRKTDRDLVPEKRSLIIEMMTKYPKVLSPKKKPLLRYSLSVKSKSFANHLLQSVNDGILLPYEEKGDRCTHQKPITKKPSNQESQIVTLPSVSMPSALRTDPCLSSRRQLYFPSIKLGSLTRRNHYFAQIAGKEDPHFDEEFGDTFKRKQHKKQCTCAKVMQLPKMNYHSMTA